MRASKKQSVLKLCLLTMSQITIVTFSGNVSLAGRGSALFEEGLRMGAHFIKSSRIMHADFPRLDHTSGLYNEYRKRFTKQPMVTPIVPEVSSFDHREPYRYGQHTSFPLFNAAQTVLFSRLGHTSGTYNEHHRRFATQSTLAPIVPEAYSSDNKERYRYGQHAHGQRINFPLFTAALAALAVSPQGDPDEDNGQDQKKSSWVDDGSADTADNNVSSSSSNWKEELDRIEEGLKKIENALKEEGISKDKKDILLTEKVKFLSKAVTLIKKEIPFNSKDHKKVTLFLGKMGAGKSTLIGYLAGASIWWEWNKTNRKFMLKFDNMPGGVEVGSKFTPCTSVPVPYFLTSADTTIFDCPGFSDSHGLFRQIVNVKLIQDVLKKAKTVNFSLTVTEAPLDNRVYLDQLTDSIQELESYIDDFDRAKEAILLVITQGDPRPEADKWVIRQIEQVLDQAPLTKNQRTLLESIKEKNNFVYTFRKKTDGNIAKKESVSSTEREDITQCLQKLPSIDRDFLSFQKTELPAESKLKITEFSQDVNEYIAARIERIGEIIHDSFNERLTEVSKDNASRKDFDEFSALSKNFNKSLNMLQLSFQDFDQFKKKLTEIIQKSSNPSNDALSNILSEIEKTEDILALFQEVAPKSNMYSFPQYVNSLKGLQYRHAQISNKLDTINDKISTKDKNRERAVGMGVGIMPGVLSGVGAAIATFAGAAATPLIIPVAAITVVGAGVGYLLKKEIASPLKESYTWPYDRVGEINKE